MLTLPAFLTLDIMDDPFYDALRFDDLQMPLTLSSWGKILKSLSPHGLMIHLSGRSDPIRHPER